MPVSMLRHATLAALALAPALLARPTLAGQLEVGIPVTITNNPVPVSVGGVLTVHNADNPALQPYTLSSNSPVCSTTGEVSSAVAQAPAGKTLVIESIDLMAHVPLNFYAAINLTTVFGTGNTQVFHIIPATLQGINQITQVYQTNQLVKYYVQGGSAMDLSLTITPTSASAGGVNGPTSCIDQFSINGYLVNTP